MNPKANNQLDDLFRDQLHRWKKKPETRNWSAIEQWMEDEALDQVYRDSMKKFEVRPSEKNWELIEPALPFHLRIRRQLQKLSTVAAVLLVLMMAFTIYDHISFSTPPVIVEAAPVYETPELDPTVPQQDHVLQIKDTKGVNHLEVNLLEEEDIDTELEELLALVIEAEDSSEKDLNKDKLNKILRPLDQLPIEGLLSSTDFTKKEKPPVPSSAEEQDLKIMIPLKVIEDHEVERFLNIYEQQTKASNGKSAQE